MRQQLELVPVEYHVAYYPLLEEAEWGPFEKFIGTMADESKVPNYAKFTTNLPRLQVIRDLERFLGKEFYYVVAFDRGDGGFYLKVRPETCGRARLQLSGKDRDDMMKCFDVMAEAIEIKANIRYEADKKRNADL
jgi:hypothetical protein